ncbi:CAF17-like 4Fe-4S cluster assembly/insertion protein YgfZ [Anaplasma capra]|uniref:CAF17-like 4Fe-4S cluster assembly/insertion protein YgfZ n=1 Tax=Anaplasma capra TaxID=1562740 RepID=UPI0021D56A84|nr:folate-binding protein [Anaplasma capra]
MFLLSNVLGVSVKLFRLQNRSVLKIYGPDAGSFLHNITTNDVLGAGTRAPIYNLILNSQGRYVFDFFLIPHEQNFLLDCASVDADALVELLRSYRLRLRVRVRNCDDEYAVAVCPDGADAECTTNLEGIVTFKDPRNVCMWARAIVPIAETVTLEELPDWDDYELLRIKCTIPDCVQDMTRGRSFPLYFSMDRLNAISTNKGCYIGQETVARMWRVGAKRGLYTVFSDTDTLIRGQEVLAQGQPAGHLLSTLGNWGLCLLEVEKVIDDCYLQSGNTSIKIYDGTGPLRD